MSTSREKTCQTTITLGEFATNLLTELNEQQYFKHLQTLPPVNEYKEDVTMEANTHPLVLMESQITLNKLNKMLQAMATSNEPLSQGYDLVLMSSLPSNDIKQAETDKIYLSEDGTYVVRDPKGAVQTGKIDTNSIQLDNLEKRLNEDELKFAILKVTSKAGHTSQAVIQLLQYEILTKRFKMRLCNSEHLKCLPYYSEPFFYGTSLVFKANEACIALANKINPYFKDNKTYVHRLIPTLQEHLPPDFNFAHYNMLYNWSYSTIAVNSSVITPDQLPVTFQSTNEQKPTTVNKITNDILYAILYHGIPNIPKLIERLYELIPQNTWHLYLDSYSTNDLLTLARDKPEKKMDESFTDEENDEIKSNIKTLLSDPVKHEADLYLLVDSNHQRAEFKTPAQREADSKQVGDKQPKKNEKWDEKWVRATYFVLISLSARVRKLLPNFLSYRGRITGYSKIERLAEAKALLEFLAADLPLATLPDWLDTHHPAVKARLIGYSGGKYANFYTCILNHANPFAECELIMRTAIPDQQNLSTLPIKSNAAYVRCQDKLLYVDKAKKLIEDVPLNQIKLSEFDKEFAPSETTKKLFKYQLTEITDLTSHAIKEEAPSRWSLLRFGY